MPGPLPNGKANRPRKSMVMRAAVFLVSVSSRFPRLERLLRKMWHNSRTLLYKQRIRRLAAETGAEFDAGKLCWIEPARIQYVSRQELLPNDNRAMIIKGNWDRLDKKVEDLDLYIAFRERFKEGKRWENTLFYQRALDDIAKGKSIWLYRNNAELDGRLADLDALFQTINKDGFQSQRNIPSWENIANSRLPEDEITVSVGRDGDFLLNSGVTRLAIARLLGIKKIPARIVVRHPDWVNFRRQIALNARDRRSGKIYQPITHPDLQDLISFHDTQFDRFRLIKDNLSMTKGRLLDIGGHWGYFCHKFEEMGFDCIIVENSESNLYFLRKLRRAENRRFEIIPQSIFEYRGIKDLNFDAVLALNIFHHFLKQKSAYLRLINLLKNLKTKEMFFQPHCVNEPQMEGAYQNYDEEEFIDFVLKNSKLSQAKRLGTDHHNRSIYKIF